MAARPGPPGTGPRSRNEPGPGPRVARRALSVVGMHDDPTSHWLRNPRPVSVSDDVSRETWADWTAQACAGCGVLGTQTGSADNGVASEGKGDSGVGELGRKSESTQDGGQFKGTKAQCSSCPYLVHGHWQAG